MKTISHVEENSILERGREKIKGTEFMIKTMKEGYEALKHVHENYEPGHPHLSELPPTGDQFYGKWVRYARLKAEIDKKRVRVPTWGELRKGFRYYSANG